ncbi:MAG: 16S rRNA (adenine(1518)-N(6)/adenine(1519)-N(6))-dimethyltransferase RsmA [Lachnospiraceae bacterium]|nr:16S rRNA (adenine(1518)-N(6)/adenine(1519)-N(6))-dimethyltransferase RsmA [Lachnospiraceae bacterium]MBQ6582948.1 16S rRNA (adenine(1518)-N(6)/adenine(1519)-N(6))-dimethyltransferase RsmA [Mogibacterium sp.]
MKNKANKQFHPSRRLGQNFLRDYRVVETIVAGSDIDRDTLVLEIGPGEGVLTEELAAAAGAVVAVEIDDRLIPVLRRRFQYRSNVEIVHGDILKINIPELLAKAREQRNLSTVRIVGNLPYYITTPIIMTLLESGVSAASITAMVQKEVADRLLAEPGTRNAGAITYAVHYYSEVSLLCDVGRECFYPVPKVDSAVLRLDLRKEPPVALADEALFFRCIKAGFSLRRKTLLNALSTLPDTDKETLTAKLAAAGIDPVRRAESLSLEEFARISNELAGGTRTELKGKQ